MTTVDGLFRTAARRYPHRSFLRVLGEQGERRLTYAEGAQALAAAVEQLEARGLAPGDRAIFYFEEPWPSVLLNLACAHLGVLPVPLSPSFSAAALERLVAQTGAKAIFRGEAELDWTPRQGVDEALAVLDRVGANHHTDDVYIFQPTSGTTGDSKLIMRPHRAFVRTASMMALDLRPDDEPANSVLLVAALTHGMGQYLLSTGLHLAAELCAPREIDTRTPLDEVRRLDPSYICVTPRVLRAFAQQAGASRIFGPAAKIFMIGGAATDPHLLARVATEGVDVIEGYGASECSLLSLTRRGQWREGSSGHVLPDVTLTRADDGELLAKTPARMVGYWGNDALTREAFSDDGWYRTGDFAEVTPDGQLRYLGRKKEVFNTSEGTNVHPARIETLLEGLPWVQQAILVGDQRPYMTALLVIAGAPAGSDGDGFLAAAAHPALYARARQDLAGVNAQLEGFEQVRRVALFATPFPSEIYRVVGHAKVARTRPAILQHFAARIAALYDCSSSDGAV